MNHRHLLPTELDLLLDGEEGFGVAPLKAHIRDCRECGARLEEARLVTDALEELAHFAPAHDFANRVMAGVPVFVPWHVAARDAVAAYIPRSRPARALVYTAAASAASVVTLVMIWFATRPDLFALASGLAGTRVRELAGSAGQTLLTTLFGAQSVALIFQQSSAGIAVLVAGFAAVVALATFGLRSIATASLRRRA